MSRDTRSTANPPGLGVQQGRPGGPPHRPAKGRGDGTLQWKLDQPVPMKLHGDTPDGTVAAIIVTKKQNQVTIFSRPFGLHQCPENSLIVLSQSEWKAAQSRKEDPFKLGINDQQNKYRFSLVAREIGLTQDHEGAWLYTSGEPRYDVLKVAKTAMKNSALSDAQKKERRAHVRFIPELERGEETQLLDMMSEDWVKIEVARAIPDSSFLTTTDPMSQSPLRPLSDIVYPNSEEGCFNCIATLITSALHNPLTRNGVPALSLPEISGEQESPLEEANSSLRRSVAQLTTQLAEAQQNLATSLESRANLATGTSETAADGPVGSLVNLLPSNLREDPNYCVAFIPFTGVSITRPESWYALIDQQHADYLSNHNLPIFDGPIVRLREKQLKDALGGVHAWSYAGFATPGENGNWHYAFDRSGLSPAQLGNWKSRGREIYRKIYTILLRCGYELGSAPPGETDD
jgi:hypothetical protein